MPATRFVPRLLVTLLLVCGSLPLLASPAAALMGDLDPNFSGDGKLTTTVGSFGGAATAMAVQPDGRIVVAGTGVGSGTADFALTRYTADGQLDPTFSGDGIAITPIGTGTDEAYAVALQPDGKIVAAGRTSGPSLYDFAVARYQPNGALDTTFGGGDGSAVISIGSTDIAHAIAIQPDGKIVVAGQNGDATTGANFAVMRFNTDGTLDNAFGGGDGYVSTPIGPLSAIDIAHALALQSDGKIVVAGYSDVSNYDMAVVRYTSAGVLDTASFGGGDGIVTTNIGVENDQAYAMALQADGKIVAAGSSFNGSTDDFAIVRYTTAGVLDTASFGGGDGIVTTAMGSINSIASGLAIQDDGKLVAGGVATVGSTKDFALARFTTSGTVDATFSGDGKQFTHLSGDDAINALAVQTDGSIVAAGTSENGTPEGFSLARYFASPQVSVSDVSLIETDSGTVTATFTLTLSEAPSQLVTVDFLTVDGTATSGSDYQGRSGTRGFLAGQRVKRVGIVVNGDTTQEATETFSLRLLDGDGIAVSDGQGVATITDNDAPVISIDDRSVVEADGTTNRTMTFHVTLNHAGTNTITVHYATFNGSAVAPGDYTAKSGTLTFTAGVVSKNIAITVKPDNLSEGTETFTVVLDTPTNASIGDDTGVGTINDDD